MVHLEHPESKTGKDHKSGHIHLDRLECRAILQYIVDLENRRFQQGSRNRPLEVQEFIEALEREVYY